MNVTLAEYVALGVVLGTLCGTETRKWLAAGVTVIGLLVPEIVAVESTAVMVCVPAVASVAVTVASPPENDALEKLRRPDCRRA